MARPGAPNPESVPQILCGSITLINNVLLLLIPGMGSPPTPAVARARGEAGGQTACNYPPPPPPPSPPPAEVQRVPGACCHAVLGGAGQALPLLPAGGWVALGWPAALCPATGVRRAACTQQPVLTAKHALTYVDILRSLDGPGGP